MNWQEINDIEDILKTCQETLAVLWENHEEVMPIDSKACEDILSVQLNIEVVMRKIERARNEAIVSNVGLNLN